MHGSGVPWRRVSGVELSSRAKKPTFFRIPCYDFLIIRIYIYIYIYICIYIYIFIYLFTSYHESLKKVGFLGIQVWVQWFRGVADSCPAFALLCPSFATVARFLEGSFPGLGVQGLGLQGLGFRV